MLKNEVRKVEDDDGSVYVRRRFMARGVEYSAWQTTERQPPHGRALHTTTSKFNAPGLGLVWFGLLDARRGVDVGAARARAQKAIVAAFPESAAGEACHAYRSLDRPDAIAVGCVKGKVDEPALAAELYSSPLFEKRRAAAEAIGRPWFVLSAKYGVAMPGDLLEPYETKLDDLSGDELESWIRDVAGELANFAVYNVEDVRPGWKLWVFGGSLYAECLRRAAAELDVDVVEPLRGMQIGERLRWYNEFLSGVDSAG